MALVARFGNLTLEQFEERLNVRFKTKDREFLEKHRTNTANPEKGKYHIFDKPLSIVAEKSVVDDLMKVFTEYDDEYEDQFAVIQGKEKR